MSRPETAAQPAEYALCAAAVDYCRAAGIPAQTSGYTVTGPQHRVQRLAVPTEDGTITFFFRREFVRSTQFMRSEFASQGWPEPGRLYLADAVEVIAAGTPTLLIPPVLAGRRTAPTLWRSIATSSPARRTRLAEVVALALRRFQLIHPASASATAEAADLAVHHASARPLPASAASRIRDALTPWAPTLARQQTGMHPRDFYINLLVGVPLGSPAAAEALTLIDYGESQKQCSVADAFAALALQAASEPLPPAVVRSWLLDLSRQLRFDPAEFAPLPLFLGLWRLRWALRDPDLRAIESSVCSIERATPCSDVAVALSALSEAA